MANSTPTFRLAAGLALGLWAGADAQAGPPAVASPAPPSRTVQFVPNQRQWSRPVLFAADVPGGRLFLERGRLVQALYDARAVDELHHRTPSADRQVKAHAYSVAFVGANPAAAVRGAAPTGEVSNYFLGNDPGRWARNVPAYGEVRYQALYPGTDLRFYTKENHLEYDFELAAGADAGRIRLQYRGQRGLRVVNGALHVLTSVGNVVEQRPYAYQVRDGRRVPVACRYALGAGGAVAFRLPRGYDRTRPLVIDPVLVYSSYTGSTASNYGYTATYDSLGNLYAGGTVFSIGYPATVGAYSLSYSGSQDIGIMKFNPQAATRAASRVYATYLGGSSDDHPHSLVVDRAGNLVVLGSTASGNYPTTASAYDRSQNGGADIVVTKLNPAGSALVASTFLGGSGVDGQVAGGNLQVNYGDSYRGDVTVDRQNNVYLASITQSGNFPTTAAAFQRTFGGGARDGVVVKLNPALSALTWSSYLGGSGDDAAYSVQLDSVNHVFVGGGTTSVNFPGTAGGYRSLYQGGTADGFVARISSAGDDLVQATYLGTPSYDQAYFVQLNRQGEVYAYGQTNGTYPVTAGAYSNPGSRQFIQKLNPLLSVSRFSTVIGNGAGTGPNLSPTAFLVDNCGQILISGWTGASGMPVTPDAIQSNGGGGTGSGFGYFYLGQLSADGQRLVYGTYFGSGSSHVDGGTSRFDKRGIIYQSMCTGTGTLPTTPNAWSATNGSGWNNAAFKIDVLQLDASFTPSILPSGPAVRAGCAPLTVFFTRRTSAGTGVRWNFGNGQTSTQANNASTVFANPGRYAVQLTVFDSTSCLQSVTTTDTVTVYGLPRAAAGPDRTICATGGAVTLTAASAGPGATYAWSPAAGLNTTSGASVTASPTATTAYIVRVTTPQGCVGRDTVQVVVRPPLQVTAGPDQAVCPGGTATLAAAGAGPGAIYAWSPAAGLNTTSGASVTVTAPAAPTRYTLQATDANGCTAQATVLVSPAAVPQVTASASALNVEGQPVAFSSAVAAAPVTAYSWNFGDNSPASTEANPTHVYPRAGSYQARLTVTYGPGCPLVLAVPVVVRQFQLPNIITPNGDNVNDTFQPFVSAEPVDIKIYNRWGRLVYEKANYVNEWGDATTPPGTYFYRLVNRRGESWKGWLEVAR